MPKVVVTRAAQADLRRMIASHGLPASTVDRVRACLRVLEAFPQIGPALTGRWTGLRFTLGPWSWMLVVYAWDAQVDRVIILSIQDARTSTAATGRE